MIQDATIFEADDITPFFGTGDGLGGVVVPDFSTDPGHVRPYLFQVKNWSASEIDFPAGSSNLGGITLEVLDKRTDAGDQGSGILTSRLKDVKGKRLLFRREHPEDGMISAFDAVVLSYSMGGGPEGLVKITLQLADIREREREQPLFLSNFVLFGAGGAQGPAIDYGAKPGGGYLLDAVAPFESIVSGGISHFQRNPFLSAGAGLVAGVTPIPTSALGAIPSGLLYPQQDADGIWRFRGIRIRWRAKGSDDPWTELRDMPWINAQPFVTFPNQNITGTAFPSSPLFYTATTILFSSFDEYDIPEDGQEIEFQVLAVEITEDTPMWWDGGSFGDLLKEIYDGEHSQEPPKIRYSAADMAAFQASTPPARFILRQPVKDMRAWVERYIYQPLGYAPGFDVAMAIAPVSWAFPSNTESIPLIDAESLIPIGEFDDGPDNVINQVFFTYYRESLESTATITLDSPPWWKFWAEDHGGDVVADPEDTRLAWQRLIETPVRNEHLNVGSIETWGVKDLDISGLLARSIAGADGSPYGGDTQDELGARMDAFISEQALGRFYNGAARYAGSVLAGDPRARDLRAGQWVRLRVQEAPNYDTGERGLRRYFQIISISDEDPSRRALLLIDGGVPDTSNDAGGTTPGGTDCASGGTLYPGAGGAVRVFRTDDELVTTCAITAQILVIAGGGGGGLSGGGGGGGGAGGVRTETAVEIAANQTIPITVGSGGALGSNGEDTVIWVDQLTGLALDPMTDDPDDAIRVHGGGAGGGSGVGASGGSGGGGGKLPPVSGGGSSNGGTGEPGEGSSGGNGNSQGGIATCTHASGGGGGSKGGVGQPGTAPGSGGQGGPQGSVAGWGVTTGSGGTGGFSKVAGASGEGICGADNHAGGPGGAGYGAGGGGQGGGVGGSSGRAGVAMIRYAGPLAKLQAPQVTSTETTDQNQNTICVEGEDWPPDAVDGYRVRVEYAVNPTEPAASSGKWRLAGYLDAPGCVTTPPVATGAKVWSRAVAEAPGYLPSPPGDAVDQATPETPGLLALRLDISDTGVATVSWTPNAFSDALRIRGLIHVEGESTARPLALLASVDAADGSYTLDDLVPEGEFATLDVEAWEDGTYTTLGRIYRVSTLNPVREILTRANRLGDLSDVIDEATEDLSLLQFSSYLGQWVNRNLFDALAPYLHAFRHKAGGPDELLLDELGEPTDVTTLDADVARHGLLPKLSGDTDQFLRGDGSWQVPPSGGDAYTQITKSANDDVTNSGTLVGDSQLIIAVLAGEVYEGQFTVIYSGSDQLVDYKIEVSHPGVNGWCQYNGTATNDTALQGNTNYNSAGSTFGLGTAAGTLTAGLTAKRTITVRFGFVVVNSGNVVWQQANNTPASGKVSRTCIGSDVRFRKLI